MGLERGFSSPDFYEGNTAIEELERAKLYSELAEAIEVAAQMATNEVICGDPDLERMLGILIERSHEWDPHRRANLRKMIALRIGILINAGLQAGSDVEFWQKVQSTVAEEVEALRGHPGLGDLPDASWEFALQELLSSQDSQD